MTLQEVLTALRNADAAGDVAAARRLAQIAQSMQAQGGQFDTQIAESRRRIEELQSQKIEPETTFGGELKEFGKGLVPGAINLLETAGTGISALLPEDTEKAARESIKELAGIARKPFEAAEGYEDSVGRKLGEGLGSTLPFFLLGPAGVAGRVAGVGLGTSAGAGEARVGAEQAGATEEERRMATLLGAPTGLLDLLAPNIGPLKNIITTALARGGVEGATEAAQQIAQNLIAKGVYNPEQAVLEGSGEQGAYGAGVGAIASVILDLTIGRRARGAEAPGEAPPAAPAAPEQGTLGIGYTAEPFTPVIMPDGSVITSKAEYDEYQQSREGVARQRAEDLRTSDPLAGLTEGQRDLARRGKEAALTETFTSQEPDLFGEIVPTREAPAAETAAPAVQERDTQTRDMIDEMETAQIREMEAEEQATQQRQEQEAQKAQAQQERLKLESDIAELDGQIKAKETKTSEDKRLELLLPIVESEVKNIPKAFVRSLKLQGFTNTNLTDRERNLINRAYDLRLAEDPVVAPEPTLAQPEGQTAELEAQIPERREARAPEQMSFPGMGKPKGKAPEAFSEEEIAAQEEKPFATKLTADVLVQTGLPKQSGFYKQLLDMDMTDPAQQPAISNIFARVRANPNLSQTTKDAIERIGMQAFGGLAKQQNLFASEKTGGKKTAKETPSGRTRGRDTVAGDDAGTTGAGTEGGKPSAPKREPTRAADDTKRTEAPKPSGLGDRGQPVSDAGARKGVEPSALKETKIHPRVAERIEAVEEKEEAKEQAEYATAREKMIAEFKAKHDREIKGAWADVQRARQAVKNAGPKSRIDVREADGAIARIEDVLQRYDRFVNLEADSVQRSTLDTLEKQTLSDLPALRKELATALEPQPKAAPKAKSVKEEKAPAKAEAKPTTENAYITAREAGEVDLAIRNLAADAYLNTAEDYSAKRALAMIKDLEDGKMPPLKFGSNNSNGPGTGGKFAKEFYDSLSKSEQAKFRKELQLHLYEGIASKQYLERYNADQYAARAEAAEYDENSPLFKDVKGAATPLHPMAVQMLKSNNLVGALRFIGQQNLGRASSVASRLASVLGGVDVEIHDFQSKALPRLLKEIFAANPDAQKSSGVYFTRKDGRRGVILDSNTGMDVWTLLHEATHGAVNQTLNNPGHPMTKQLQKLFDDVKDSLGTAYGAQDLKEFAAEAFSNTTFQQTLAGINPKGEKITAWQRFVHAVKNYVRSLLNEPTKPIGSALDSTDYMIEAIVNGHQNTSASLESVSLLNKGSEFFSALGKRAESLPGMDREKVGAFHEFFSGTVSNTAKTAVRMTLPLNALVEVAQKYIPMAPKLDVLVGERSGAESKRNQAIEPVIDRVGAWADKNPQLLDKLNNVIYRSTLDQVDPSKPRAEYVGQVDKSGNKKDVTWDELQADWKALGASGQSVYNQMRDTYKKLYGDVRTVLDARIDSAIEDADTRKKVKAEIYQRLFESGTLEPYFPLTRTGKYWVSYTLGNEFYVEAYETGYQRDQAMKEMQAEGATDVQKFANLNQVNYRRAPATSFVNNVLRTLEANKVNANVTEEVMRLFLNTLPETSFAQSFRRRKGTLGFQRDAVGALRMKVFNLSRQLSNMEYGAKFEKLREEMKDYVRSQGNPDEAVDMMNELDKRIDYAISPEVPMWAKLATSFGFNMTLGFNVSSALVNMSQVPLVVMPYLGGKYGFGASAAAVGRATRYFTGSGFKREVEMLVPTDKGEKTAKVGAFPSIDNYDFSKADAPKHLKVLSEVAGERGQLNRSQVYDILDVDESQTLLTKINAASGFVFHHAERMNRQVAMIAAYELELGRMLGKGKKFTDATEQQQREAADYAVYVTELTNGGTAAAAAPRIAQGPIGKVIFMYKRYGVSMYYMLFKTARDALKSADPEVRKAAKRQIAGIYASSALMAGVQGIPMFGVAAMVYNLVAKEDDEDDFDTAARKYFGEGIYSGAINALTGVNVATRLGLSDLLFRDTTTRPSDSVMMSFIEMVGGPVIGVTNRMIRGLELINDGNIERGIEQILPSAIGNMFKSVRFGTEGANTLRGDPIAGEMNPANVFAQFFGFAPAEYTRQLEINASLKNIERKALDERTKLLRKYYIASRMGDMREAADLMGEMLKFNRKYPGAAITPQTIQRSMAQHMKTTNEMYHGITISKALRPQLMANAAEYDGGLFSGEE